MKGSISLKISSWSRKMKIVIVNVTPMQYTVTFSAVAFSIVFLNIFTVFFLPSHAAVCTAEQYCPKGWKVQRRTNNDATTCDIMEGRKCESPYQCIHSKCGMSFCCANQEAIKRWKMQENEEFSSEDDDRNEL
ncbi:hypothetical protein KIN20_033289 [Parelaphostrongylus tenuis]|uniref:Uncharacterized protein n=1 Tax=Parelaphostrongylus tenuis TaxID=148309 RepID=A0AAD5WIA0_PARTN|nr:hypothetical protein KIN20_033289 [Parelaphostrongylus tenuis]